MWLAAFMEEEGLKDGDLAAPLQVARTTVGRYRTGEWFPNDPFTLVRIRDVSRHRVMPNDILEAYLAFRAKRDAVNGHKTNG